MGDLFTRVSVCTRSLTYQIWQARQQYARQKHRNLDAYKPVATRICVLTIGVRGALWHGNDDGAAWRSGAAFNNSLITNVKWQNNKASTKHVNTANVGGGGMAYQTVDVVNDSLVDRGGGERRVLHAALFTQRAAALRTSALARYQTTNRRHWRRRGGSERWHLVHTATSLLLFLHSFAVFTLATTWRAAVKI